MKIPETLTDAEAANLLRTALGHLLRNEFEPAEQTIQSVLDRRPQDPEALHLFGQMRRVQNSLDEAEQYYRRTIAVSPSRAEVHFHLGQLLRTVGRTEEAVAAFEEAIRCKPNYTDAYVELGILRATQEDFASAEKAYRQALRIQPNLVAAKQGLVATLIGLGRIKEAEATARSALAHAQRNPGQTAALLHNLGTVLSEQQRHAEAVQAFEQAQRLAPELPHTDYNRAGSLEMLGRMGEAEEAYRRVLARDPSNLKAHGGLNRLLYRMDRKEFLESYDEASKVAPDDPRLHAAKGRFLFLAGRCGEACDTYERALDLAPDDLEARDGHAGALAKLGRFDDAVEEFEHVRTIGGGNVDTLCGYAECLLRAGDPEKAAKIAEEAITLEPHHQAALALWATALEEMSDARVQSLNDYENLVQIFDLAPPPGFSDMESFNRALDEYLARLHFDRREHINQTSRFGTKTQGSLFGAGHGLVERLKVRIDEAVAAYIARMKDDTAHPLHSRRGSGFVYPGSWSTRLADQGFHVNHVHPKGWISSAYYIALPDVVAGESDNQGWIKFGEPSFETKTAKPVRRTVQPEPGRLVLFPSYMWHGTVPFRSEQTRSAIAFDVVPGR